jgi:hypothetical protein
MGQGARGAAWTLYVMSAHALFVMKFQGHFNGPLLILGERISASIRNIFSGALKIERSSAESSGFQTERCGKRNR